MKLTIKILLALLFIFVSAFFLFRTPDTDRAEMIAKYSNSASQFADDGAGGKIHYRDEGNKGGAAILLIHGSNGHLQTWEPVIAALGDQYRLISFDLYGHGLTGPNPAGKYDAETMIGAGMKILDTVGVEKAYWAGNSMGGWLVWRAALSVPERMSGLILIDSSGAQTGDKVKPYLGARLAQTTVGQWLLPEITPRFLIKSSLAENYAQPERLTDEIETRYWEMLRFPGNRQATLARSKVDRERQVWSQVGEISLPTLILWGEQDSVIPLSHGQAFEDTISGAKLISYSDAGHLPMEETPAQVARDIGAWIADVEMKKEQVAAVEIPN